MTVKYYDGNSVKDENLLMVRQDTNIDMGYGPKYAGSAYFHADRIYLAELISFDEEVRCFFLAVEENGQNRFLLVDSITSSRPFRAAEGQWLQNVDGVRCIIDGPCLRTPYFDTTPTPYFRQG